MLNDDLVRATDKAKEMERFAQSQPEVAVFSLLVIIVTLLASVVEELRFANARKPKRMSAEGLDK